MTSCRMWVGIAALVVVLVGGGVYYNRSRTATQPRRVSDPGLAVLSSIRTLESEPATQLSKDQIAKILPFVKSLKDIPLSDADAVTAIARAVTDTFTPAQNAALEEARKRFQEQQGTRGAQAGGAPTVGGPSGVAGPPGLGGRTGFSGGSGSGGRGGSGASRGGRTGSIGGFGGLSSEQRAQFRARAFDRMIGYLEQRMK
jgi:hypothetical protein